MILGDLADPGAVWEYAERYLGVGTRSYSPFSADLEISDAYHPQRGAARFDLPSFWVPEGQGAYLTNRIASGLHGLYRHGDRILLPVHPETLTFAGLAGRDALLALAPGPPVRVAPSANARTVFVTHVDGAAVPPHFLKLHYPRRLSRFTRRLRRPIIELQLWVAGELARAGTRFLPEVAGGVFGTDPTESWGYVVREASPAGSGGAAAYTVPLFALYGGDYHRPDDPTLLEQLVRRAGEDPAGFLCDRIVGPMIRMWLTVLFETGCALEPHGQNTLFAFAADSPGTDLWYRDCEVYVDPVLRAAGGLDDRLPRVNIISRDIQQPRERVFSLVYDSFMGHHALAFLARLAQERLGVAPGTLHDFARRTFARHWRGACFMPPTVYYYDAVLRQGGTWRLVDTGRKPDWR